MTEKVKEALEHVSRYHEGVDTVIFLKDGRWLYMNSEAQYFPSFEDEINISILEAAADSIVELPSIYQL